MLTVLSPAVVLKRNLCGSIGFEHLLALSCVCVSLPEHASSVSVNMHRFQQALKLNFAVVLCDNSHVM